MPNAHKEINSLRGDDSAQRVPAGQDDAAMIDFRRRACGLADFRQASTLN
jgi:hypothetical protein